MSVLRNVASFLRWRLVPVRHATRLARLPMQGISRRPPIKSVLTETVQHTGYHAGPTLSPEDVAEINAIYRPRIETVEVRPNGHPFVNLFSDDDITADNPVMRLAFSAKLLDTVSDYFGGACILDSIQVLYSWPTEEPLRESQKWHKDYGDSRSFHCIVYLNDVTDDEAGPFVFVDKSDTRRIAKSPFIRRIEDEQFKRELGEGQIHSFHGKAGESVFVDPAACYHYGSRCRNKTGRLAIFVTFNTPLPFAAPQSLVTRNRQRLMEAARVIRPDLSTDFLNRLLQLPN